MQLTERQTDAMGELINIAFARTAASLSTLTGNRVELDVPQVRLTPIAELPATLQRLRSAWQAGKPSLAQRRADLVRLRDAFRRGAGDMDAAIRADFGHRWQNVDQMCRLIDNSSRWRLQTVWPVHDGGRTDPTLILVLFVEAERAVTRPGPAGRIPPPN